MKKPIISFKNFSFKYHKQQKETLKNINLDIFQGEKLLILGASGSGKSTLGYCINGLIPNQYHGSISGECLINGKSLIKSSIFELSKIVGTVLQDSDAQFVGLSVAEDIAFALENKNMPRLEMKMLVKQTAEKVKIAEKLNILPHSLSGGQKQRASVAGILHENIDILLLDEPLAALDPVMGKEMIELIDELNQVDNKTVVIIEHRLEDVLHRHIDRIVLMDKGEIVAVKTPDDLLSSDLLTKYGIREPLYLSAIKKMLGGLKQKNDLTNLEKIDLTPFKDYKVTNLPLNSTKNHSEVIISLKDVKFSYDNNEFIDIKNLNIRKGERIALLGENGSGKSTIAKILTGIIKIDKGEIFRINNPETIQEIAKVIGYVMQNPNQMLVSDNIFDEVALALRLRNYSIEDINERVNNVLKITGLYSMRNWPISVLSYGQKKRLSVAVCLALNPQCLILDEPTAGQDYRHYREMMEFIALLNKKYDITTIFITHDMHLALEYSDRALVVKNGKIVADKDSESILSDEKILNLSSLKKTSIFDLSEKLNLNNSNFIKEFIEKERRINE